MKSSVQVRPWQVGDLARLRQLGPRLSPTTLRSRFWGSVLSLPDTYLNSIGARWPHDWNAVVAIRGDRLVGWAEYGRNAPGSSDADAAFCVVDAEQGRGLGTALLRALVVQADHDGILALHADIAPDNAAAWHAWRRVMAPAIRAA